MSGIIKFHHDKTIRIEILSGRVLIEHALNILNTQTCLKTGQSERCHTYVDLIKPVKKKKNCITSKFIVVTSSWNLMIEYEYLKKKKYCFSPKRMYLLNMCAIKITCKNDNRHVEKKILYGHVLLKKGYERK